MNLYKQINGTKLLFRMILNNDYQLVNKTNWGKRKDIC